MADEATDRDDDTLELTDIADDAEQADADADQQQEETDELVIAFDGEDGGDDEADQPGDNNVVRQMRQKLREKDRELAELRKASAPKPVELGPKPTLEECGYDEDAYDAALLKWQDDKRKADAEAAQATERQAAQSKLWEDAGKRYEQAKAGLKVPDYADAEAEVEQALGPASAIIAMAANDPAKVAYALGKSPARLAELVKLKDNPIGLAAAIARIEGGIVVKKRTPPSVDKPVQGSAPMPGGTDKKLAQLEKEADRTGDRTALLAYKRELRAAGKL